MPTICSLALSGTEYYARRMLDEASTAANETPHVTLGPGEQPPVQITAEALEKMRDALDGDAPTGSGIRMLAQAGGCSGAQYGLGFEQSARDGDLVMEISGIKFYIDPTSRPLLEGCTVDFMTGPTGSGFKFHNPAAQSGCSGCSCG